MLQGKQNLGMVQNFGRMARGIWAENEGHSTLVTTGLRLDRSTNNASTAEPRVNYMHLFNLQINFLWGTGLIVYQGCVGASSQVMRPNPLRFQVSQLDEMNTKQIHLGDELGS